MSQRPLGLICVVSAAAVLAVSGCGGGGSTQTRTTIVNRIRTTTVTRTVTVAQANNCGHGVKVQPGGKGGRYGGTYYPDVKGGPVVSARGGATSCDALLALADAFATKTGPPLTSWLKENKWRWMNTDPESYDYMNFDRNDFEVFFSTAQNGSNGSQVAFPRG